MPAINEWLAGLGLGEYAPRFAENDIDFTILPDLTDQDLEKIGVASLGHRRKILRAIAALDGATAAKAQAAPPSPPISVAVSAVPPPRTAAAAETAGAAERRYLTVLFCDLVGSTGIAAKLDAEEWHDLVGAYLDAASAAVTGMGGHVAKKLGDGLMALFGYPVAQENDAERAARAALAIQRALAEFNRKNAGAGKPELVARIGLEAGPVVVDAAGEIFGDAPNVAARVQALTEPGAVLITAQVQRQVAGLFVVEDRGSHALKGVSGPTALYRLIRASGGGRRSAQRNLTPLVGRDDEMTMLVRRWERARQGDGQLVMMVGEPGLGKSRLIEEFHARLRDTPHTWVEWSCSQLLQNTPLHPIAEWGRARFGGADVPAERRLAELESSLAQVKLDPAENAPLLAPLLDIPLPKERVQAVAAEELRRRQLAALTNWVMAGAKVQPVVLAFEDLHWADPTTLDFLRGIAERGALAPLFIVATTRPEFRPPWSMRSHHGTISLAPLDRAQVRDMVAELSARHALPKEVVEDVAARTGGVPLFVEEVTRLLLERGGEGSIQAIPPTLQQSLMARLDRLGPAREVAQIGSVIGRGFSYGLLRDVAGLEDAPLQAALEKLAEADIVLVQGVPPESDYRFKHALIQDAAYENLLKSRRQVLHRRVAEILRDRFADTVAAEPEVLAHHFTQAGLTDAAIEWWGKAGDQALRRSAFQEAISHLGKAIEMADKAEEGKPREAVTAASTGHRLKLQTDYGQALAWSRGFTADETKAAFARAHEIGGGAFVSDERFVALNGQWSSSVVGGPLTVARDVAETFLREAQNAGRVPETGVGLRYLGMTCLWQGDLTKAEEYLGRTLKIYNPKRDHAASIRYGPDAAAAARVCLAHVKWYFGDFTPARELIREAVAYAAQSDHIPTVATVYIFKAWLEQLCGDAVTALRTAENLLDLSQRHGLALHLAVGRFFLGWARAKLGDREAAIVEARQALAAFVEQGAKAIVPGFQGPVAVIEAEAGDAEEALARIDEALALAAETGFHLSDAFLHNIRGNILLKRDPADTGPAEQAFLTAIDIAHQQKSRSYGLQAALALAKLYQSTGRAADAHAVLAPALEGFSPTPEFPEIEQAQALLAALATTDEVKNSGTARQRRPQLQTSYSQALLQARGQHSPETQQAFSRARELAGGIEDPLQRFSTYYGLWVGAYVRWEKATMFEVAELLLKEAETRPQSAEACIAQRIYGTTCWTIGGDTLTACQSLANAVELYHPDRDLEHAFQFGQDIGVSAHIYLAVAQWVSGDCDKARTSLDTALAIAGKAKHLPTTIYAHFHVAWLEMIRLDPVRAKPHADAALTLAREHGIGLWMLLAPPMLAWADACAGKTQSDCERLRATTVAADDQRATWIDPIGWPLLAACQADAGQIEAALATADRAIADVQRSGVCYFAAESHRIRGEILLKRDPANTAPAEEAFLTAIAVAQRQNARSFGLRAALSLAKLYQSTDRAADAHDFLAPALSGFVPTPEFPEIEEAQTLLAALAATDQVKNAADARQRRLKLQTSYAQATMLSRGFGSEESKAAFTRARELATQTDGDERFDTYYGLWIGSFLRGELQAARESAEVFLREAESAGRMTEAAVAHRNIGLTCLLQGDFAAARANLEHVLRIHHPERDRDVKFRFASDNAASATVYLGLLEWQLGNLGRGKELLERAVRLAVESNHPPTLANAYAYRAIFEMLRGNAAEAQRAAQAVIETGREYGTVLYSAFGAVADAWARTRLGDSETGIAEFRQAIAAFSGQGNKLAVPLYEALLAEIEADRPGQERGALARIDEALALACETGERNNDALLHRIRGHVLLKCDPADTAPAEEAFLTAIAIAQQQKTRSFELRAALSLAKLYQSTDRPADAHAVLGSALEGFSPTPEFPEIEEAQALLDTLTQDGRVKGALAKQQVRAKLHVDYARAVQWGMGFAADETKAAFARAGALAAGAAGDPEYWALMYGRFASFLMRGEFVAAHEAAASYLRQAQVAGRLDHLVNARRLLGTVKLELGAFRDSRVEFEALLANWDEDRDRALRAVTGADVLCVGWAYMAQTLVCLGEVEAAVRMSGDAIRRAQALDDFGACAFALTNRLQIDAVRGRPDAMREPAEALRKLVSEKATPLWELNARGYAIWARDPAHLDPAAAANEFSEIIAAKLERKEMMRIYHWHGLLAQLQSAAGACDDALVSVAMGLEIAAQTGGHCKDSYLYRVRGDVLKKRDAAAAEAAYREALRVAHEQSARAFELQAVLGLAKLYQSTGRTAAAHDILVPALAGFSPTPEFPEIEEAQTLLAAL